MKGQNAADRLEKAYFELLKDTHYSKITVSDIIKKAEISRTTFYRYYVDIFDMHKKISDKFAFRIIEECSLQITNAQNEHDYIDGVLKVLNSQEKYIILISGINGSRYFFEAMLQSAKNLVEQYKIIFNDDQFFTLRFMSIAMVGVYVKDLLEGREHNPYYIEICKELLDLNELFGDWHTNEC